MPVFTNEVTIDPASQPISVTGTVTATPTGTQDVNVVSTVTVPVSGPLTDTQLRATPVPVSFSTGTTSAAVTSVASSATNVTLLASNASRKGALIYNDSTKNMYLKFGATASTSSFTVLLTTNAFFEFPSPCYTGQVDALWSSANGNARITELS